MTFIILITLIFSNIIEIKKYLSYSQIFKVNFSARKVLECVFQSFISSRVRVNAAKNKRLAQKITRPSRRRVLFFVPLPVVKE